MNLVSLFPGFSLWCCFFCGRHRSAVSNKKHSSWPLTGEPRRGHSLSQSKDFYEEIRIRVFRPPPSIPMESPTTIVADNLQINAVYTLGHKNPADVEGGYFVFVRVPALPRAPRAQGALICSFRSLDFSSSGGRVPRTHTAQKKTIENEWEVPGHLLGVPTRRCVRKIPIPRYNRPSHRVQRVSAIKSRVSTHKTTKLIVRVRITSCLLPPVRYGY